MSVARLEGTRIVLPGIATAHSHAFQRALRGRTQRKSGSFWSWRGLMYALAEKLTPDDLFDLSRFAFVELASAGVTAVGEFHYVHHQPDGTPYDDRTELASAVVRAALDAGIRISLLRVLYHRPGHGRAIEGSQRRFFDASLDDALDDVSSLAKAFAGDPRVAVGLAPHSVRAVPIAWIEGAHRFAEAHAMPLHMHVSEQRREIQECLAEHGRRPVTLLDERGVLGPRFVAVHATHLDDDEVRALGRARAFCCLCRSTERDLGDGLPRTSDLLGAGARLCFGVDSHALSDPFEEARAAELDERSRTEKRVVAAEAGALLEASSGEGYAAIGMQGREHEDEVVLDATAPALVGTSATYVDDAVIFGAGPRCVREVTVAGERIVEDGRHVRAEEAREAYVRALARLG